jgi:hypothetical protein
VRGEGERDSACVCVCERERDNKREWTYENLCISEEDREKHTFGSLSVWYYLPLDSIMCLWIEAEAAFVILSIASEVNNLKKCDFFTCYCSDYTVYTVTANTLIWCVLFQFADFPKRRR